MILMLVIGKKPFLGFRLLRFYVTLDLVVSMHVKLLCVVMPGRFLHADGITCSWVYRGRDV